MNDKQLSSNQLLIVLALLVSLVASFRVEEQDNVYFTKGKEKFIIIPLESVIHRFRIYISSRWLEFDLNFEIFWVSYTALVGFGQHVWATTILLRIYVL